MKRMKMEARATKLNTMQRLILKNCTTSKWQEITSPQPGLTNIAGFTPTTTFMRDSRFIPQMVGLKPGTPGWTGPYVPPAYNKWTLQGWKIKVTPIIAIEFANPGGNVRIPYPTISDYGRHMNFTFWRDKYCDAVIPPVVGGPPTDAGIAFQTWYNWDGNIAAGLNSDVLMSMHSGLYRGSSYTIQHRVKPTAPYAFPVNNNGGLGGGQAVESDPAIDLFSCVQGGLVRNLTYMDMRCSHGDNILTYESNPVTARAVNVTNTPTGFNLAICPYDLPVRTGEGTDNVIYMALRIESEFYVKLFDLRNWSGLSYGGGGRGGLQVLLDEHALATGVLAQRLPLDDVQSKRFNIEFPPPQPDPNIHVYNDEEATKNLEIALAKIKAREERQKRKEEEKNSVTMQ